MGDIKQAFLNIGINEADRDVLRFLWISNINEFNPDIIVRRFARVQRCNSFLMS